MSSDELIKKLAQLQKENELLYSDKVFKIAFEEYHLHQFSEAAKHFDMAYINNPDNFLSAFLRDVSTAFAGVSGDFTANLDKVFSRYKLIVGIILSSSDSNEVKDHVLSMVLEILYDGLSIVETSNFEKHLGYMFIKLFENLMEIDIKLGDVFKETKNIQCKVVNYVGELYITDIKSAIKYNSEIDYSIGRISWIKTIIEMNYFKDFIHIYDSDLENRIKKIQNEYNANLKIIEDKKIEEEARENRKRKFLTFLPFIIVGGIMATIVLFLIIVVIIVTLATL